MPSTPGSAPASETASVDDYPAAERLDLVEELHGRAVADPYRWLEDPDDERTRAWGAAQDELFAATASAWPGRAELTGTLTALLGTGSVGPPVHRRTEHGELVFSSRREPSGQHGVVLVRAPDGEGGSRERVLVDPVALDRSGATTLDSWSVSREGDLLAYQVSEGGREESVLRVLDVATGEDVDGPIGRARYSPVGWLPRRPDGSTSFFYVRRLAPDGLPADERQYHRRVRLHTVAPRTAGAAGSAPDSEVDPEIFGAGLDMTNYYGVWTSRDGRWLVVSASAGTAPRTDVWLADLAGASPAAPDLRPVAVGLDAQHSVWVGRDGRLYVHTDLDAPRGRLCVADTASPGVEHWRDLVPEDEGSVLADVAVLDSPSLDEPLMLLTRTRHAVSELALHRLADGRRTRDVALPGLGSLGGLVTDPEDRDGAWVTWTDHTTPPRVLRVDGTTGEVRVWALPPGEPPAGPGVTARQLVYTSTDGTEVRMFVVARSDALAGDRPLAPAPTVLYGYGGFGISLTPGYSASILAWVRAGGVWAVANLRGGSEEGEAWHRAGMREHKQNVFDDFAGAADFLVEHGWTTREQLAVSGGSNGGLLVGAAVTQRSDAYAAVLCSAPLLDMVRYERHGLGITWNDEYGTADDPTELGWLLSYSPYHHVKEGTAYPAVLFTVFDGDTRVDPLHARKLAAALQHATASDPAERPVLLRREADVGHGARSLDRTIALAADGLLFLAAHTGLRWGSGHPSVRR